MKNMILKYIFAYDLLEKFKFKFKVRLDDLKY